MLIGAYCILDDKPRNGLSHTQNQFLQEMAKTVMDHLISIRAQAENLRSIQMVRKFNCRVFIARL